jgi:hypothetical protein
MYISHRPLRYGLRLTAGTWLRDDDHRDEQGDASNGPETEFAENRAVSEQDRQRDDPYGPDTNPHDFLAVCSPLLELSGGKWLCGLRRSPTGCGWNAPNRPTFQRDPATPEDRIG